MKLRRCNYVHGIGVKAGGGVAVDESGAEADGAGEVVRARRDIQLDGRFRVVSDGGPLGFVIELAFDRDAVRASAGWTVLSLIEPQRQGISRQKDDVDKLVDNALSYLDGNKRCEDFFNEFLQELHDEIGGGSISIRSLLESMRNSTSITIDYPNKPNLTAKGSVDPITRKMDFSVATLQPTKGGRDWSGISNALVFIHEAIHLFNPFFSDGSYARAGERMGLTMSAEEFARKYPDRANRYSPQIPSLLTAERDQAGLLTNYFCEATGGNPPRGALKATYTKR